MRLYLSGPINSPQPDITPEQCRANFYKAAAIARERWEFVTIVNPLECAPKCLRPIRSGREAGKCGGQFDGHEYHCWMRGDLVALMECDAALFLPGHTQSRGARLEFAVAQDFGLYPYFMSQDMERII